MLQHSRIVSDIICGFFFVSSRDLWSTTPRGGQVQFIISLKLTMNKDHLAPGIGVTTIAILFALTDFQHVADLGLDGPLHALFRNAVSHSPSLLGG